LRRAANCCTGSWGWSNTRKCVCVQPRATVCGPALGFWPPPGLAGWRKPSNFRRAALLRNVVGVENGERGPLIRVGIRSLASCQRLLIPPMSCLIEAGSIDSSTRNGGASKRERPRSAARLYGFCARSFSQPRAWPPILSMLNEDASSMAFE